MKILIFAPRAAGDIDEIHDFTAARWSLATAESYIGVIRARCEALARGNIQGLDGGSIRPGYRRLAAGARLIFYPITGNTIEVIRILHAGTDFGRHF